MVTLHRTDPPVRRFAIRLFVLLLVASLVLPPALPVAAASPGVQPPTAGARGNLGGGGFQEGEPAAPVRPDFPVPGPGDEPAPTPVEPPEVGTPEPLLASRAPAPVLLEVRSPQAVVLPGAPFTVTVSVAGTSAEEALPAGLAVSVQLPGGVAPVSADSALEWTLPALAPGEALSQTVALVARWQQPAAGGRGDGGG